MAQRMFGLQWIDRKYIAINSNTTPISDRFTCQKEVEFVILSAIFYLFLICILYIKGYLS